MRVTTVVDPSPGRGRCLPGACVSWIHTVARVAGYNWISNVLTCNDCTRLLRALEFANIKMADADEADRLSSFMNLLDLGTTHGLRLDYEPGEVR